MKVSSEAKKLKDISKIGRAEIENKIQKYTLKIAGFKELMADFAETEGITDHSETFSGQLKNSMKSLQEKLDKNKKLELDSEDQILKILKDCQQELSNCKIARKVSIRDSDHCLHDKILDKDY